MFVTYLLLDILFCEADIERFAFIEFHNIQAWTECTEYRPIYNIYPSREVLLFLVPNNDPDRGTDRWTMGSDCRDR